MPDIATANGTTTEVSHDAVAVSADTRRSTPRHPVKGDSVTSAAHNMTHTLRTATVGALLLDPAVVKVARIELARRYGLFQPDACLALGILIAEGLTLCEAAWADTRTHVPTVAGYARAKGSKPVSIGLPAALVAAVEALTAEQFPGVEGHAGRVGSAVLLHGAKASAAVVPTVDPGLAAVLARVEGWTPPVAPLTPTDAPS